MTNTSTELLHGTLETLVLKTLAGGRRHGYGIARAIEEATDGVVEIEDGSLYPALYRMERKGSVEAEWGVTELGRRAKFYRLTPKGRRQLAAQSADWARFAAAISRVLSPQP
jgi:transcriptional regulator